MGIRLYLRAARGDRREVYYIRHGSRSISTECGIDQLEQANQKLAEYIARHYKAPKNVNNADKIYIAEVLNVYLTDYAPSSPSRFWMIAAGTQTADGPLVLRHSCVTLFVKAKVPLPEIAAFTGMTAAVLERYYRHQTLADQENIAQTAPQKRAINGSKRA